MSSNEGWFEEQRSRPIEPNQTQITPLCCPEVDKFKTIVLLYSGEDLYGSPEGQAGLTPSWKVRFYYAGTQINSYAEAKFCPHCGTDVPEIRRRATDGGAKICTITDGGYYCDSCGERLQGCSCYPPAYRWEPVTP